MIETLLKLINDASSKYAGPGVSLPRAAVTVPPNPAQGDFTTGIAFGLAPVLKKPPLEIAAAVAATLRDTAAGIVETIDVVKPGHINFLLRQSFWHDTLDSILEKGAGYGSSDHGGGHKVLLEYISANPTGPIHVGHGRGAVIGDVLARILASQGYEVTREYYINDAGNQVLSLGYSVLGDYYRSRHIDTAVSRPGEYQGAYIHDISSALETAMPAADINEEHIRTITEFAVSSILDGIRQVLGGFDILFDRWFSEKQLFGDGSIRRAISGLEARGAVKQEDGATWFLSTRYGDEKDRVLQKQTGELTYFASDIAYHVNKYERGYDLLINIWGADHHGYLPRVRAAMRALGYDPGRLAVLFVQMVRLTRGDKPVAMSKRAGEYVTLKDLVDEAGTDAVRFFFLQRSHESQLVFDIELAKKQSQENPVYYVQYAHARIASIFGFAAARGWPVDALKHRQDYSFSSQEKMLLSQCLLYPGLIRDIAARREPHRLTHFLVELVGILHKYYTDTRVVDSDADTEQRLLLMKTVKIVLKNALDLLGIHAPEKMEKLEENPAR